MVEARKASPGEAIGRVVRELRGEILDGRLRPGDRIGQAALADRLGVSRSPVREALRELQAEGLVAQVSNVGARVVSLDADAFGEVYWLRERIEPGALAAGIAQLEPGDDAQLRSWVEQMEQAAAEGDHDTWHELDRVFHFLPLERAGLARVQQQVELLWNQAAPYRRIYTTHTTFPDAVVISHAEHRLLLDAIERREPSDAERLLAVHIRRTRLALRAHPELFERPPTSTSRGNEQ